MIRPAQAAIFGMSLKASRLAGFTFGINYHPIQKPSFTLRST
jgi:hypothetical protein